ncbi:acetyltransferase [Caulobacter mirabilis]|uniref:Acetyltransferase n=1 Tax=Caulobacter mirabilis TaxID=69666 RepID=A0A2D2AZY6_9CAUL|nr:acetyltransferase [Caulobacter mirabilis]ATQ43487.1 acetyltransferase [Caulobacter mirabilis]
MITIRASAPADVPAMLEAWREAVRATHDFLSAEDFVAIEAIVAEQYLPAASFAVAVDEADRAVAFMGLSGTHLDALFVHPDHRGAGVGKALMASAPEIETVDVNEQNPQAVGFYERQGFRTVGRSPLDDAGRPYPILHMRRGV